MMNQQDRIIKPSRRRRPVRKARAAILTFALAAAHFGLVPASWADVSPPVPMTNSAASFVTWHQGFEHGTDGWYDSTIPGPIGWCGAIERATARAPGRTSPTPSAGHAYATVAFGACNEFWQALGVVGAPYGPGPDLALYSDGWPQAGYVTELDIYLDPAWSGEYKGNFAFAGDSPDTLVQLAATVFPTGYTPGDPHTGPHWFVPVEAAPGRHVLDVLGARIERAGWYTFRFLFSDVGGAVSVDFALRERSGKTLVNAEDLSPVQLLGPFKLPYAGPLPTDGYGSGHVWFFDVAWGLSLPIDEHRVRRGR